MADRAEADYNRDRAERARGLYQRARDELITLRRSGAKSYDRALLGLSTAFLGISLTFLRDIVSLAEARFLGLLKTSWVLFGIAILSNIALQAYVQWTISDLLTAAEAYYLHGDEEASTRAASAERVILLCNTVLALIFAGGIVSLLAFVWANT